MHIRQYHMANVGFLLFITPQDVIRSLEPLHSLWFIIRIPLRNYSNTFVLSI